MGHTHTAYSTETFFDEVAHAAGRDPFELRVELLKDHPRHRAVLELAAAKAGWGKPPPPGRARGIALQESFSSFVAQVAEVSLRDDGLPKVERVVCAVDCGVLVNPDVIRAQMEGGIGFGLGAALWGEITLDKGQVVQSNFHDYPSLRFDETPAVEVHIVPSPENPTGVGEPGVPVIAPAVANALFHLSGQRVRRLPFVQGLDGGGQVRHQRDIQGPGFLDYPARDAEVVREGQANRRRSPCPFAWHRGMIACRQESRYAIG